jgi:hypothetical protein
MPDQPAAVQDVIGCLYEGVSMSKQWPDALDRVSLLFGSMAAHFFLCDEAADRPKPQRQHADVADAVAGDL